MKHRVTTLVILWALVLSAQADAGLTPFKEISAANGINLVGRGRGSAWADINDDGRLDLGVALQEGGFYLYLNDGNLQFREVAAASGIPPLDSPFGVSFVDVDNDGDSDLFLACGGYQSRAVAIEQANRLFLNDGRGHFSEVAEAGGLALNGFNFSSSWSDVNGDGLLDVFICRVVNGYLLGDNRLFLNRGGARFEDVTETSGIKSLAFSQQAIFFDVNQDGSPDLFITNRYSFSTSTSPHAMHSGSEEIRWGDGHDDGAASDCACGPGCLCAHAPGGEGGCGCSSARAEPSKTSPLDDIEDFIEIGNRLFLNNGVGHFTDVSPESGLMDFEAGFPVSAADYDRDGDLDLFVGTYNFGTSAYFPGFPDRLFRNEGFGVFAEVGAEAGVASMGGPMGSAFIDFDNDGWCDLYVARGGPEEGRVETDKVYRNQGDGTFKEASRSLGLVNKGAGHGMTAADADGDGDLDIVVPSGAMELSMLSPTLFFENTRAEGAWIAFRPEGENGNRDAVNASVLLEVGGFTNLSEILAGTGFGSQPPLEAWFGLGDVETVDRVRITWRSGASREATSVPARRRVEVMKPVTFSLHEAVIDEPDVETATVRLSWEDPRRRVGRFVAVVEDAEGSRRYEEVLSDASTTLELLPGEYHWFVELRDDLGLVHRTGRRTIRVASPPPVALDPATWFASPNPFFNRVSIDRLPGTEDVTFYVKVLDVRGRHVATVDPGSEDRPVWDGTDAFGQSVPAGLYFLRVVAPGREQLLKVIKTGQ